MADDILTNKSAWTQVRKEGKLSGFQPYISLRGGCSIGISADFVRLAAIENCTRADVFRSENCRRIGFSFHSDESKQDSFTLSRDGGGSKKGTGNHLSRVLQVRALKGMAASFRRLQQKETTRRYFPKKDVQGIWYIDLAPCFERKFRLRGELSAQDSGIYRYCLGGETVYLGRGILLSRFSCANRKDWQFDEIEYSIVNDEAEEIRWEAYWLDDFRQVHNRWPIYNMIGGKRSSSPHAPEEEFQIG